MIASNLFWLFFLGQQVLTGNTRLLIVFGVMAIASNAWAFYARQRDIDELGTPEMASFTPEGCGQRTGPGKVKRLPWRSVEEIKFYRERLSLIITCKPVFMTFQPVIPLDVDIRDQGIDDYRLHQQLMEWHDAARQS
jgi:hypothetical protein